VIVKPVSEVRSEEEATRIHASNTVGVVRCLCCVLLTGMTWVAPDLFGTEPEYIAAEAPPAESLKAARSVTENIGIAEPDREITQAAMPKRMFPLVRDPFPETGIPFLDDAAFTLSPRAYYFHRDFSTGEILEAFAIGGAMRLETGWLNDAVRVGVEGFNSTKIYGPEDRGGTGLLRPGQKSYTVLGQAYVNVKTNKTFGTFGRQRIDLPYINAHDIRMTPNTFEAITVGLTDLGDFQLGMGHITKIRFRNQSSFEYLSDFAGAEGTKKGVTGMGVRYNFSDKSYAGMINQYGWDMYNTIYAESERYIPVGDELSLRLSAQFTDQRSVGDELLGEINAQQAGVRFSIERGSLAASGSFVWTARGSDMQHPWGGSPSYNSVMIGNFDRNGERSARVGLVYDFSTLGLSGVSMNGSWTQGNTPDTGVDASPDEREWNVTLDYKPEHDWLEDIWFRVRWARNSHDENLGGIDRTDFRVILNYSVAF
jgi:hypothetical protein